MGAGSRKVWKREWLERPRGRLYLSFSIIALPLFYNQKKREDWSFVGGLFLGLYRLYFGRKKYCIGEKGNYTQTLRDLRHRLVSLLIPRFSALSSQPPVPNSHIRTMTLHSIIIQKLLSTNAHLGRRIVADHFKVYTYGFRNNMAIIDSDKTIICMRNACNFIAALARQKARFMFVNTNQLYDEIFEQMMKKIGCYSPNANTLWRQGGFLTNSCSPKKFRSRNKKVRFGPVQPPDCVVVLDTERKSSVINEADRLRVPIVALVDSSMPLDCYRKIAYPVPANDSPQFVYLFCNLLTKTFMLEHKKMGHAPKDEPVDTITAGVPEIEAGDQVEPIKQSKDKVDFDNSEAVVIPYDNLAPLPEGEVSTDSKMGTKLEIPEEVLKDNKEIINPGDI